MRLWLAAFMLAGCAAGPTHGTERRTPAEVSSTSASSSAEPEHAATAEARRGEDPPQRGPSFEPLDVPGYLPAVLGLPAAGERGPIIVVTHGAGGRPEADCARYQKLTEGRAFLLCTRGRAINAMVPLDERRYFYDGHIELGREVVRALAAFRERYPDRADFDDVSFAGYSQGAAMGILYLQNGGARETHVKRVLLVEGGAGTWSIATAESLRKDGVERLAIVCGQTSCHELSQRSVRWIERAGLEVRASYAPGAGHTDDGAVGALVVEAWTWLTAPARGDRTDG
jgi:pimeloyl-ACP methyl ester carboxylesterase